VQTLKCSSAADGGDLEFFYFFFNLGPCSTAALKKSTES
jgi:hypothetical protein